MTNNLKAERTLTAKRIEELRKFAASLDWCIDAEDRADWDLAFKELQHLRAQSLSTQQPMGEVHGPFGYLVGNIGLNEEYWTLEMEPVTETDYFSIPLYAKVDPLALHPNQESGE